MRLCFLRGTAGGVVISNHFCTKREVHKEKERRGGKKNYSCENKMSLTKSFLGKREDWGESFLPKEKKKNK